MGHLQVYFLVPGLHLTLQKSHMKVLASGEEPLVLLVASLGLTPARLQWGVVSIRGKDKSR